jgi:membrane protein YdbS with pleckstrin-like domain
VPHLREPRERVSRRAALMWFLGAAAEAVATVTVLLLVGRAWAPFDIRWWMPVTAGAVAVAYVVVVPVWKYAVHRWEVTDTAVYTQTGWWTVERRIAPMSRIQTVDFAQGPLERFFSLARVTVTTASAAGALQVVGLDEEEALGLVEDLTERADSVPGDAT